MVDPRFYEKKARKTIRASVVSKPVVPEQEEKEPESPPIEDGTIEVFEEESEEFDAHYADL